MMELDPSSERQASDQENNAGTRSISVNELRNPISGWTGNVNQNQNALYFLQRKNANAFSLLRRT